MSFKEQFQCAIEEDPVNCQLKYIGAGQNGSAFVIENQKSKVFKVIKCKGSNYVKEINSNLKLYWGLPSIS